MDLLRATRCKRSCWSQLLPELLVLILQKLTLLDCFSFGRVCESWQSIFLDRCSVTRPPPFILLFPYGHCVLFGQPLWSFQGGKFLKICSPRPEFNLSERIVGSSNGWLVIGSVAEPRLRLLNPISNERVLLPLMASDGTEMQYKFGYNYVKDLRVSLFSSPITNNCVVVATGYTRGHGRIALCRPGDHVWITYREPLISSETAVRNMVIFSKGELYLLPTEGDILVCAFNSEPRITGMRSVTSICRSHYYEKWLVDSDGELLLVVWHRYEILQVFKQAGDQDSGWVRLHNLGDRVLLVGGHITESFQNENFMGLGFEANCIYFCSPVTGNLMKFSMLSGKSKMIQEAHGFDWITAQTW